MADDTAVLDPEELKRNLAITLGTQGRVLPEHLGLPSGPEMAAPGPITLPGQKAPDLSVAPPAVKGPRGTLDADKAERSRMLDTGSGISQIYKKVTGSDFGQNHPVMGKVLGGLAQGAATIGDIGLNTLGGGFGQLAAQQIPGTAEHHAMLLSGLNRQIGNEEGEQEKEAQTANLSAQPELHQAQLDIQQGKLDETQRQHDQQLREHGFKVDDKGQIVPLEYGEMSPDQQAVHDLKASQQELADAHTALAKAQKDGIPAAQQMAQQRIATAQQNARTAAGRLGLAGESLQFREEQAQEKADNPAIPAVAQGRASQGRAIVEAASHLQSEIDANKDIMGNLGSYWTQAINGTPISNPKAAKLMAEFASFAALQPALHGFRSHDALKEFAKMIGGIPNNPDSAKAAIQGIVEGAANPMIHAGTRQPKATPQTEAPPTPTFKVKLSDAMALPQNKGKSEADVEADVKKHGGKVVR